jgi:hypothetical protein
VEIECKGVVVKAIIRHAQQRLIVEAFQDARIDYKSAYLRLYASYNAWYRFASGHTLDTLALEAMKQRYEIWRDYFDHNCLELLRSPMRRIYVLTQHRPLITNSGVSLALEDDSDWQHLIDFWYVVRCDIVHNTPSCLHGYYEQFVRLAYESLMVYMTEVVSRLSAQERSSRGYTQADRRLFASLPESHLVDRARYHLFKSADISLRSQ